MNCAQAGEKLKRFNNLETASSGVENEDACARYAGDFLDGGNLMLKRLAAVIWWAGLLALVTGITAMTVSGALSMKGNCRAVAQTRQAINSSAQTASPANATEEAPERPLKGRPSKRISLADQMAEDVRAIEEEEAKREHPSDSRDTPALRDAEVRCASAANDRRNGSFYALLLISSTVVLWAASFVLGGRFWRPPALDVGVAVKDGHV